MAKHKIPKNRSIEDMIKGVKEDITFETADWNDEEDLEKRPVGKKNPMARRRKISGNSSLRMICRPRWEPFFWGLKWNIIRMESAILD